jgi:hypothetical protein
MEHTIETCTKRSHSLHKEGYPISKIESILRKEGWPDNIVPEVLCQLKLSIYKKRKGKGVLIMGIGGFLLISGFVVTVIMFHMNYDFNIFMYTFTSIGTMLMGYGAYEVLQ